MTHGDPNTGGTGAAKGAARSAPRWDPFERVYTPQGAIDRDYASKRLPNLVDLLRRNPAFFPSRIDVVRLGEMLLSDDAKPIREAADQDGFEAGLRAFSESHLHQLVTADLQNGLAQSLMKLAQDEDATRRDRASAALGVALLSVAPDRTGLRGRGLMDLVLRVTMEEQTAQETLRRRARETEGGLPAAELQKFWDDYPALRWHHEERYRREVTHVLRSIETDQMPPAISVDLGMRGASLLMAEVAKAKSESREIDARRAEEILRVPFVQDMAEDGAKLVFQRWSDEMRNPEGGNSEERRAVVRSLEMGARIVEEQGPGSDAVLFYLYMRAVVQGHYFVRDDAELEAAKSMFQPGGLVAEGALTYAAHLAGRGDTESQRRVLVAAFEIWPAHAGVRDAAEKMGLREEAAARAQRLGPTYGEEPSAGTQGA